MVSCLLLLVNFIAPILSEELILRGKRNDIRMGDNLGSTKTYFLMNISLAGENHVAAISIVKSMIFSLPKSEATILSPDTSEKIKPNSRIINSIRSTDIQHSPSAVHVAVSRSVNTNTFDPEIGITTDKRDADAIFDNNVHSTYDHQVPSDSTSMHRAANSSDAQMLPHSYKEINVEYIPDNHPIHRTESGHHRVHDKSPNEFRPKNVTLHQPENPTVGGYLNDITIHDPFAVPNNRMFYFADDYDNPQREGMNDVHRDVLRIRNRELGSGFGEVLPGNHEMHGRDSTRKRKRVNSDKKKAKGEHNYHMNIQERNVCQVKHRKMGKVVVGKKESFMIYCEDMKGLKNIGLNVHNLYYDAIIGIRLRSTGGNYFIRNMLKSEVESVYVSFELDEDTLIVTITSNDMGQEVYDAKAGIEDMSGIKQFRVYHKSSSSEVFLYKKNFFIYDPSTPFIWLTSIYFFDLFRSSNFGLIYPWARMMKTKNGLVPSFPCIGIKNVSLPTITFQFEHTSISLGPDIYIKPAPGDNNTLCNLFIGLSSDDRFPRIGNILLQKYDVKMKYSGDERKAKGKHDLNLRFIESKEWARQQKITSDT